MASTPIYNWPTPDNTDLVKNGALAIRTLGNAIDTTTATLVPKSLVDAKGDLVTATANDTPARLAVGANGETLVADSSTSTGLSYQGNYAAGKNKIINGDFKINQRGFTSVTANITFTFDRWRSALSGGTVTYTPQTFTLGAAPVTGYEGSTFLQVVTAGQSASSDFAQLVQPIESVRTFAGQTVTMSFFARATSGTPKLFIEFSQWFGSGGSPSSQVNTYAGQVTISTSWARYSVTVAIPSISGKTLGTDNGDRLEPKIWFSAGSNFDARTGSLGVQNNTFQTWGVQVEAGSVATAFQTATGTIQGELAACLRYYWRSEAGSSEQKFAQGPAFSTTNALLNPITLPSPMRVKPTALDYGGTIWLQQHAGVGGNNITALNIEGDYSNTKQIVLNASVASGLSAGTIYELKANSSSSAFVGLSAEL